MLLMLGVCGTSKFIFFGEKVDFPIPLQIELSGLFWRLHWRKETLWQLSFYFKFGDFGAQFSIIIFIKYFGPFVRLGRGVRWLRACFQCTSQKPTYSNTASEQIALYCLHLINSRPSLFTQLKTINTVRFAQRNAGGRP